MRPQGYASNHDSKGAHPTPPRLQRHDVPQANVAVKPRIAVKPMPSAPQAHRGSMVLLDGKDDDAYKNPDDQDMIRLPKIRISEFCCKTNYKAPNSLLDSSWNVSRRHCPNPMNSHAHPMTCKSLSREAAAARNRHQPCKTPWLQQLGGPARIPCGRSGLPRAVGNRRNEPAWQ